MDVREIMEANKRLWDEKTRVHVHSKFYDVEGFKEGKTSLFSLELEELGDVRGKSILHLQCHFGLDTLSLARMGAVVTGVDFSKEAIEYARRLSNEIGIEAEFISSNIYHLKEVLSKTYDIVYTSYGVLCWLPDLLSWGELISHFLKKGGLFFIVEGHPFSLVYENERETKGLTVKYSYFHSKEPMVFEPQGTYAQREVELKNPSYEWTHSLGDIVNALLGANLQLESLKEYPFSFYDHFPFMVQDERGLWHLEGVEGEIPLLFSIRARKGRGL